MGKNSVNPSTMPMTAALASKTISTQNPYKNLNYPPSAFKCDEQPTVHTLKSLFRRKNMDEAAGGLHNPS
jgi:hypothetical protein